MIPSVGNKEGKSVERAIYPVQCFWRVTWLAAMRTWLSQGAKHLELRRIDALFVFYARFFMNAGFILSSARVFSRNRACVSVHSRPRPQHTIWIELSHRSIFEFLACDFSKTSYVNIPCFVYSIKASTHPSRLECTAIYCIQTLTSGVGTINMHLPLSLPPLHNNTYAMI